MVSVTQEQKEFLESKGFMVIEFKAWCKKYMELFVKFCDHIVEQCRLIHLFIQQKMFELADSIKDIIIRLIDEIEPVFKYLADCKFEEKPRFGFVRSIGKKYLPRYKQRAIYHRCRNNC